MFDMIYRTTGLRWMHSTDLVDMQRAFDDEDEDGPDGGSPFVRRARWFDRERAERTRPARG